MTRIKKEFKGSALHSYFSPSDFLVEAIDEFLESGKEMDKLPSCIIKTHIATELIIKKKLEKICPALILDELDKKGFQLIKLYGLEEQLVQPDSTRKVENMSIRTAPFSVIVKRAAEFIDLSGASKHLTDLNDLRNSLVHHNADVTVNRINILLAKKIFPLLKTLCDQDGQHLRVESSTWKKLEKIGQHSDSLLHDEIIKRLEHHAKEASSLSPNRISSLMKAAYDLGGTEWLIDNKMACPACSNNSLALIVGVDFEGGPDGVMETGYHVMRCLICRLELDETEIELIASNPSEFYDKQVPEDLWLRPYYCDPYEDEW